MGLVSDTHKLEDSLVGGTQTGEILRYTHEA